MCLGCQVYVFGGVGANMVPLYSKWYLCCLVPETACKLSTTMRPTAAPRTILAASGALCAILAASPEPTTKWAREIGVGGKRIIAWEPPQQARAASLLGQDSACEGGVGTCVVACTDFACSAAQVRCAALAWCVGFSRPSKDVACGRKCLNRDATLKRGHAFAAAAAGAPDWWVSASRNCLDARRRALAGPGGEAVRVWVEQGCDVYGAAWPARSSTLVFDVGLAGGEDTRLFLSRGWRVLAVEANPAVARAATTTPALRRATEDSSLVVVGRAIVARATAKPAILRVPRRGNSEVASLDPGIAAKCRRLGGCAEIRVPTTTCLALIREHGLPTVLKVDIEGLDRACVESLAADPAARPRYVMIEDKSAMDLLTSLGYTRFKLQHGYSVAQARVAPRARGGAPWEVINAATGTLAWSTAEEINAALARGLRRQPHDLYAALTEPHADEAEFMRAAVAE